METTALGAAYLAGLSVEFWNGKEELRKNWNMEKRFCSRMEESEREHLLDGWSRAVKCAQIWAEYKGGK